MSDTRLEFTGPWLSRVRPSDKLVTYRDTSLPGLELRVSPTGSMVWAMRARVKHGAQTRLTLGRYPEMSLKAAREAARDAISKARQGDDPARPERSARQSPTVQDALDAYLREYETPRKRSAANNTYTLRKHLRGWYARKLATVTRQDAMHLLGSIAATHPTQANRVHSLLRKMWKWSLMRFNVEAVNPFLGIERPAVETPRDRVLSAQEIKTLWRGSEVYVDWRMERVIKLLLLTGQRLGELLAMRWEDVDLEQAVWTIPAGVSKNKAEHRVPLVGSAVASLKALEDHPNRGLVLPSLRQSNKPSSRPDAPLKTLRAKTGILFTFHDLRRTVASGMAQLGVSELHISMVLNHLIPGVTRRHYVRYGYDREKREALERWERHLLSLVN